MRVARSVEPIAKKLRQMGYDNQTIYWEPDGTYNVLVEGEDVVAKRAFDQRYAFEEALGHKTVLAAYRQVFKAAQKAADEAAGAEDD